VRLLADENIPRAVIAALARQGHDISAIGELERGANDRQIVARAEREGRILLTFDKDFGDIAFGSGLPPTCGIILFRFTPRDPDDAVAVILTAIALRQDWAGRFAVVERDRLRVRRLRSLRPR
jgi:predicted nuclease of predicted toxin-antitoxin system